MKSNLIESIAFKKEVPAVYWNSISSQKSVIKCLGFIWPQVLVNLVPIIENVLVILVWLRQN